MHYSEKNSGVFDVLNILGHTYNCFYIQYYYRYLLYKHIWILVHQFAVYHYELC